jgi:hypothetical protein
MMTGCAAPMPPSAERSPLPADLLTQCPNLLPLDDAVADSVLRKIVEISEMYYECARGKSALIEAIKVAP